ncbi:DUF4399 domain-containing protein [Niastella caeni]|uniref:DUF4399 domain-containing protein n=1 Tax=Niastella caeni TaxID=2569763 RepID=A0A4V4H0N3_9BACT|nr:DUF4399 domain-containing protein [Niastella caeni]THU37296.1 DUF4399 domain-containing protein [Niastella caeni]
MRKIDLIPFLILGLVACNDGRTKDTENAVDTAAAAATTDTMHHHADAAQAIEPLPAIPDGAKVFFVNLKNDQKIKSPFKVEMGVSGIALDTAGAIKPASGHHHILIDAGDSLTAGTVVPKDSAHLHFGNAQKEAELKLTPGEHKLTLQYADGIHRSYGGKLAASVTVTVQK